MATSTHSELEGISPIIGPGETIGTVSDTISGIVDERKTPIWWFAFLLIGMGLLQFLLLGVGALIYWGTGIWGINQPVGWGFAIINFVWWIGIGHAGTLISAVLLLFNQDWRNSINRFAEAMTLFAVSCAGLFPLLHTGRPWVVFFMFPYPSTTGMWPQFRSPLMWDVFAINAYLLVSLLFWYTGLIPDLATMRDRAAMRARDLMSGASNIRRNLDHLLSYVWGFACFGWRGSAKHWLQYEKAYLLLGGLSVPLVVSVHSIVSLDFAVGLVPGWHMTVFPPYFVAGAVYCGFAMVLLFMIPMRKLYGLENFVTMRHIDNMAKVMLASGLFVSYGYGMELFFGWYSAVDYEQFMVTNRLSGPYWMAFWSLILFNVAIPQLLWFQYFRQNVIWLFGICIAINIGMWLERYVIVVVSLTRDFIPAAWGHYHGTIWDWILYIGTFGQFIFFMALFMRFLPMINAFEMKHLVHSLHERDKAKAALRAES